MVTTHSHPGLVAIVAELADDEGSLQFSSGLLISPRLVLCSRHGVTEEGELQPEVQIAAVGGPRGDVRLEESLLGTVAWAGAGDLDAALVELPSQLEMPDNFLATEVAWGELIGSRAVPVVATGMPDFAAASTRYEFETETVRGEVDPGTYAASDRYAVNLTTGWPERWQDWQGVSGAAVCSEDGNYLLGVVAWSDKALGGRRLTAVPVHRLLTDQNFCEILVRHLGSVPRAEPVELAPWLSHPQSAGSPGALLRADAALTAFVGRDKELALLQRWRDEPVRSRRWVKVMLVTGRGGEGKTRLGAEFISRSAAEGWVGGLLHPGVSPKQVAVASHPARPLLLVIDYAAAHSADIVSLVQDIVRARPRQPVRLLLLARTAGPWWANLAAELGNELPGLEDDVLALRPLLEAAALDRAMVFTEAARSLAPHLAPFTERSAAELGDLVATMTVPDLAGDEFAHALTIQMAALAALLQQADPLPEESEAVEDTLLRHERRYRNRLATRHSLQDLEPTRDRAVAGAALFGARGASPVDARQAACSLVAAALTPELDAHPARQRSVADWIAGVYPPDRRVPGDEAEYWGQVLPDRLGEFLVARLLAEEVPTAVASALGSAQADLLKSLADCTDRQGMSRAMLTLSRAAEHESQASDWITRLVFANPNIAAPAALHVAIYAENPVPLRDALVQLALDDSDRLNALASAYFESLPAFSLPLLDFSVGLSRELAAVYRELVESDRETFLPYFADTLSKQAIWLAQIGRNREAITVSEEAVSTYRELVEDDPSRFLPDLARSLTNHAHRLGSAGRAVEGLEAAEEAVRAFEHVLGNDRSRYLPYLAVALDHQAIGLEYQKRYTEALAISERALAMQEELAGNETKAASPELAAALANHALRLWGIGRHSEAECITGRAVAAYEKLAEANPGVHMPPLAKALNNHALQVAEMGDVRKAIEISERAIAIYSQLIEIYPDAYMADLGRSLSNYAMFLGKVGRSEEAEHLAGEAVSIFETFVFAMGDDSHMPALMNSNCVYAEALLDNGHIPESVSACLGAVTVASQLPEHLTVNAVTKSHDILRRAFISDGTQVEQTFREITGIAFPDHLKRSDYDSSL